MPQQVVLLEEGRETMMCRIYYHQIQKQILMSTWENLNKSPRLMAKTTTPNGQVNTKLQYEMKRWYKKFREKEDTKTEKDTHHNVLLYTRLLKITCWSQCTTRFEWAEVEPMAWSNENWNWNLEKKGILLSSPKTKERENLGVQICVTSIKKSAQRRKTVRSKVLCVRERKTRLVRRQLFAGRGLHSDKIINCPA